MILRSLVKAVAGNEHGFGLIQVLLLIIILGIVVATGMQLTSGAIESARRNETITEMNQIAAAIAGNPDLYANGSRLDFGYLGDVGAMPSSLQSLVTDPGYGTWDGPYLQSDYSNYADDYLYDAWGVAYQLTGVEIKSFGPGTDTIVVTVARSLSELVGNTISGFVKNEAGEEPGSQATNIQVVLTYPDGAGSMRDSSVVPAYDGSFEFVGFVPCGNHRLRAVYSVANDTTETIVSVLPGSTSNVNLRLASLPIASIPALEEFCLLGLRSETISRGHSG
jgi:type II secretory pathway pseudopilin PulG